jgi:ribosomal RNA methyltransferase Nop2
MFQQGQEEEDYSSDSEAENVEEKNSTSSKQKKEKKSLGGGDAEIGEDWMGSSESDEEDHLLERQKQLQRDDDEFREDLKTSATLGEALVDLNAPAVDYDEVRDRASTIILTLQNLKSAGDPEISRKEYLEKLFDDLCRLFGYNRYLIKKVAGLLKIGEIMDFLEANEHPRPVVIRTNTLRTRRKELERVLNERGIRLGPVGKWTKLGLVVFDAQVPVGSTPEYLAGHYMLQSPSSFLPVMALNPQPNTRVLDMCAAPGGKTTHIAQLMRNTGVLVANDYHKARTSALIANIHRLGVVNTIVVNYDGRAFPELMGGFDQVLLDAPCSGTGVIARDPTVKQNKSQEEVQLLSKTQKELILHAYDSVKAGGGRLVYCTCSVLVEENEEVVDYLLNHRSAAKVVPPAIDQEFDEELTKGIDRYEGKVFRPELKNSRRVYPHRMNMDGFYFAVIEILPHQVDSTQKPVGLPAPKEDTRRIKKRKFSKRFGGK